MIHSKIATGISRAGTVIVGRTGHLYHSRAVYWLDGSPRPTVQTIAPLPGGNKNNFQAVSGNGIIAVGSSETTNSGTHAFSWKSGRSPEVLDLGVPDNYERSYASGVNNDGTVIVGASTRTGNYGTPTRWRETEGNHNITKELLSLPTGYHSGIATDANSNGTLIVGYCRSGHIFDGYDHAIYLPEGTTTGVQQLLCLGEHSSAHARAVSDNGNVIVGYSSGPYHLNNRRAVRWIRDPSTGNFNISDLMVCPEGSNNCTSMARGVNHDGTVIVGTRTRRVVVSDGLFRRIYDAFIWTANPTPLVQTLIDVTAENPFSRAQDVTTRTDGTNISVGASSDIHPDEDLPMQDLAVRWIGRLGVNNLLFPQEPSFQHIQEGSL